MIFRVDSEKTADVVRMITTDRTRPKFPSCIVSFIIPFSQRRNFSNVPGNDPIIDRVSYKANITSSLEFQGVDSRHGKVSLIRPMIEPSFSDEPREERVPSKLDPFWNDK